MAGFWISIDGWAKLGQGAVLSFKFEFESTMEDPVYTTIAMIEMFMRMKRHVECGTGLEANFTIDPGNGFVRLIMKSKNFEKFTRDDRYLGGHCVYFQHKLNLEKKEDVFVIEKVVESLSAFFGEFFPKPRVQEEKPKAKSVSGVDTARD